VSKLLAILAVLATAVALVALLGDSTGPWPPV